MYLKLLTTAALTTMACGLFAGDAFAADPNNPARLPTKTWNWECIDEGWEIEIQEFDVGQDIVTFQGSPWITKTRHGNTIPAWFRRDYTYADGMLSPPPEVEFKTVVEDATKPNNGKLCSDDGYVIGIGAQYVILRARNSEDWKHTFIQSEGVADNLIGLNAGDVMERFRARLASKRNAGPLPPTTTCPSARSACFLGIVPAMPEGMGVGGLRRTSLADVGYDMATMSGQDIYLMMRGPEWGTSIEDLNGLSVNLATTLANLGIINTSEIVQDIKGNRGTSGMDGNFVFRQLESSYHPTMLVIDDGEDDLQLYIRPKLNSTGEAGVGGAGSGSWPTNQSVDQSPRPFSGPLHLRVANPNYCAQNDPRSDSYMPHYLPDSKVMLELYEDYAYLTGAQEDRIEQTGWAISEKSRAWNDEQWAKTIIENPNGRRLEYGCMLLDTGISPGAPKEGIKVNCQTKDVAYYDALIDRLIVINPALNGSVANHPCNALRRAAGSVRPAASLGLATKATVHIKDTPASTATSLQEKKIPQRMEMRKTETIVPRE